MFGGLANILPQAVTAVSSQIESYFKEPGRLSREALFPALAFILSCVAVAMGIVGPESLESWWKNLLPQFQLLVGALAVFLVVLASESSRILIGTVRQLYSGEFPNWGWWQRFLRFPHLRDSFGRATFVDTLRRTEIIINNAGEALDVVRKSPPAAANASVPTSNPAPTYPVLRIALDRYQPIAERNITWAAPAEVPEGEDVLTSMAQLYSRYTLAPIAAGQPITAGQLRLLPDPQYLSSSRQLMVVPVPATDIIPPMGSTIDLHAIPPGATAAQTIADLFVVDHLPPAPEKLLVSVSTQQAAALAAALRGDVRLSRVAVPPPIAVVPVAACDLSPGQLIERRHVAWKLVSGRIPDAVVQGEADLLDHTYWPTDVSVANQPATLAPLLRRGKAFYSADLVDVRVDRLRDENDGRDRYRTPYRLQATAHVYVCDEREQLTPYSASALRAGDVVTVAFDNASAEHRCHVFAADAQGCYIAVRDATAFGHKLAAAHRVTIDPFRQVAVFGEPQRAGSFIDLRTIEMQRRRGGTIDAVDACGAADELRGRYLPPNVADLPRGTVVDGHLLPSALPAGWARLKVESGQGASLRKRVAVACAEYEPIGTRHVWPSCLRLLSRWRSWRSSPSVNCGDLVTICLEGINPPSITWHGALVVDSTADALVVAVPEEQRAIVAGLWQAGARLKVVVTHSDTVIRQRLEALRAGIAAAAVGPLNRALAAAAPRAHELEQQAGQIRDMVDAVSALRRAVDDRPWARCEDFGTVPVQLASLVTSWSGAVRGLQKARKRSALLMFPTNVADTRPTRFGNILAAAAEYPLFAYGIDTATILPKLLDVLGLVDTSVQRLINVEATMNMLLLFSFLSALWTIVGALALLLLGGAGWVFAAVVLVGPFLWWLTREAATAQAVAYGEALKTLFDLKRRKLLVELGLARETDQLSVADEEQHWQALATLFVWRTTDEQRPLKFGKASNAA